MDYMHVLISYTQACIIFADGEVAAWLPNDAIFFTPEIPQDLYFRTLNAGYANFEFAYTFFDYELDVTGARTWWESHLPTAGQEPPDIFKNNSIKFPSKTTFSVVARLLKQAGAEEIAHVSSPLTSSWDRGDLVLYVTRIVNAVGIIAVDDNFNAPRVRVNNYDEAKR